MKGNDEMFKLEISTDNAAFDDPDSEVARILRELAGHVEAIQRGGFRNDGGVVFDRNGNRVGAWSLDMGDDESEG